MQRAYCLFSFVSLLFLALLVFPLQSQAGKIDKFSADQVIVEPSGKTHTGKLYVMPGKIRMKTPAMQQGANLEVIVRQDLNATFMLNMDKKLYFKNTFKEGDMGPGYKGQDAVEKILGKEKVSGYRCTKKLVTSSFEVMGMKRKVSTTVWESKKFEMPLRTKGDDGTIAELKNIKKGKQPSRHFEVPKGFRQVSSMMELMGATMGEREPETGRAPEAAQGQKGFQIPKEMLEKLPEGFELPFNKNK